LVDKAVINFYKFLKSVSIFTIKKIDKKLTYPIDFFNTGNIIKDNIISSKPNIAG